MPKFLEHKLQAQYGKKSSTPYKVMNSRGLMHGNKETTKGREMADKHRADMVKRAAKKHRTLGSMMAA